MRLIYVAGNTGSGKTSLISALAERRPWFEAAEANSPLDYMADLFADPVRWALETQIAFLVSKAAVILNIPYDVGVAMVDRSIYEHAEVFAKVFRDSGAISDRGYRTYQELYGFLLKSLPAPALVLLCSCPADVCEHRVHVRNRPADRILPAGLITMLDQRIRDWVSKFHLAPIYSLNTERFDVRESSVAEAIACDIERLTEYSDDKCDVLCKWVQS